MGFRTTSNRISAAMLNNTVLHDILVFMDLLMFFFLSSV